MYSTIFGEIRFFHTNAAFKLCVQPLFSQLLIYHLVRLVLHVFNSRKFCFEKTCLKSCLFPSILCWFGAQKITVHCHVAAHVYI